MQTNLELDEKKLNTIKLRILQLETDNIVKKESNPAMEEKIKKLIIAEVDNRSILIGWNYTISVSILVINLSIFQRIQKKMSRF